uniref:Macro domain-containing protein n=1 Tax=Chromera velia CCMP2878 TaxID=1169474 RepID=A0A0G4I7D0_9ALVE|eukprot:Cvel_11563.t1-p1 / transcript=Cvel_11563.t1 / gene=Cvel_11563 / organism=Chromera_velia_CCMP2878 / gene_product=hypothetical protein / transcript_product=hypothetical protein / location=Cvel_scaffold730:60333-67236(+) / protein_length=1006 / sequence_SO=supercontig / SO=protein_coding / is_pseudo=false
MLETEFWETATVRQTVRFADKDLSLRASFRPGEAVLPKVRRLCSRLNGGHGLPLTLQEKIADGFTLALREQVLDFGVSCPGLSASYDSPLLSVLETEKLGAAGSNGAADRDGLHTGEQEESETAFCFWSAFDHIQKRCPQAFATFCSVHEGHEATLRQVQEGRDAALCALRERHCVEMDRACRAEEEEAQASRLLPSTVTASSEGPSDRRGQSGQGDAKLVVAEPAQIAGDCDAFWFGDTDEEEDSRVGEERTDHRSDGMKKYQGSPVTSESERSSNGADIGYRETGGLGGLSEGGPSGSPKVFSLSKKKSSASRNFAHTGEEDPLDGRNVEDEEEDEEEDDETESAGASAVSRLVQQQVAEVEALERHWKAEIERVREAQEDQLRGLALELAALASAGTLSRLSLPPLPTAPEPPSVSLGTSGGSLGAVSTGEARERRSEKGPRGGGEAPPLSPSRSASDGDRKAAPAGSALPPLASPLRHSPLRKQGLGGQTDVGTRGHPDMNGRSKGQHEREGRVRDRGGDDAKCRSPGDSKGTRLKPQQTTQSPPSQSAQPQPQAHSSNPNLHPALRLIRPSSLLRLLSRTIGNSSSSTSPLLSASASQKQPETVSEQMKSHKTPTVRVARPPSLVPPIPALPLAAGRGGEPLCRPIGQLRPQGGRIRCVFGEPPLVSAFSLWMFTGTPGGICIEGEGGTAGLSTGEGAEGSASTSLGLMGTAPWQESLSSLEGDSGGRDHRLEFCGGFPLRPGVAVDRLDLLIEAGAEGGGGRQRGARMSVAAGERACAAYGEELLGVVVPVGTSLSFDSAEHRQLIALSETSTDLTFPSLEVQLKEAKEKGPWAAGEFFMTRHSALGCAQVLFHLVVEERPPPSAKLQSTLAAAIQQIVKECDEFSIGTLVLPLLGMPAGPEEHSLPSSLTAERVRNCLRALKHALHAITIGDPGLESPRGLKRLLLVLPHSATHAIGPLRNGHSSNSRVDRVIPPEGPQPGRSPLDEARASILETFPVF